MPKTKKEKLPKSQVKVTVELTDEEFKAFYDKPYKKALSQVEAKGFRKGNVPEDIAATMIDQEAVFKDAVQEAARENIEAVSKEENWTIIAQPQIEVTDTKDGLTYTATLTLFPEVDAGDYKKIAKKHFKDAVETKVSDEEEAKTIERLRNSRAKTVRVDRETKEGDLIEVDVETTHDEKPVEGANFTGDRFVLGESNFIKGFDEALVGKKENDVATFTLTAPEEYWNEALRGKELAFKVTIKGVFDRSVPELDDEFAQSIGEKFKTVADLKKSIQEGLSMEKEQKELEKRQIATVKEIAEKTKVEIPDVLKERMLEGLLRDTKAMMPKEQQEKADDEALKKSLEEQAEQNIKAHLAIYTIAEKEGLKPTQEEVAAEAALAKVDVNQYGAQIYDRIQNRKVFNFLKDQAETKKDDK